MLQALQSEVSSSRWRVTGSPSDSGTPQPVSSCSLFALAEFRFLQWDFSRVYQGSLQVIFKMRLENIRVVGIRVWSSVCAM